MWKHDRVYYLNNLVFIFIFKCNAKIRRACDTAFIFYVYRLRNKFLIHKHYVYFRSIDNDYRQWQLQFYQKWLRRRWWLIIIPPWWRATMMTIRQRKGIGRFLVPHMSRTLSNLFSFTIPPPISMNSIIATTTKMNRKQNSRSLKMERKKIYYTICPRRRRKAAVYKYIEYKALITFPVVCYRRCRRRRFSR